MVTIRALLRVSSKVPLRFKNLLQAGSVKATVTGAVTDDFRGSV